MAGRKRLEDGEKRRRVVVWLLPAQIAWLERDGQTAAEALQGMARTGEFTVPRGPVGNPAPAVGMRVSPYSGKPLCSDCQRKGANIKCRACGANARGTK